MAHARVCYGWWVALAFSSMVFLSTGIRFTVGPFLKPGAASGSLFGGYLFELRGGSGASFSVSSGLRRGRDAA